jgi:hypothetical protein
MIDSLEKNTFNEKKNIYKYESISNADLISKQLFTTH